MFVDVVLTSSGNYLLHEARAYLLRVMRSAQTRLDDYHQDDGEHAQQVSYVVIQEHTCKLMA